MDLSWFTPLADDDPDERLHDACLHVLDTVQDYVAEDTTDPWPGIKGMPEPVVVVAPDEIKLSYRHGDETVLALTPIARRR
jgi:hypothetical protein